MRGLDLRRNMRRAVHPAGRGQGTCPRLAGTSPARWTRSTYVPFIRSTEMMRSPVAVIILQPLWRRVVGSATIEVPSAEAPPAAP